MDEGNLKRETYYAVSISDASSASGVFQEFRLGPRARGRVMRKEIFDRAIRDADKELRHVLDEQDK